MLDLPYKYSTIAFEQGNYRPSFVSKCIEDLANNPNSSEDAEELVRQVAVIIYLAGIDTIEAQIRLFILAMALHPDVQKKAQEGLGEIVGRDNLIPSFSDLSNLPYLNRFADDVINGYFIPKGTYCFGNSWLLLRSKKEYGNDTHIFRPEKFLDGSAKSRTDPAFGYGRRVCPGKALAESFLAITAATILHVMNTSTLENEPLTDIVENDDFAPGVIGRPRDFRCRVHARPDAQNVLSQFLSH